MENNENSTSTKVKDDTVISLNKDRLYETFCLFQKYLSTNKKEESNINKSSANLLENNDINQKLQELCEKKSKNKKLKNESIIIQNSTEINNIENNFNDSYPKSNEEQEEKFDIINNDYQEEINNNDIDNNLNINKEYRNSMDESNNSCSYNNSPYLAIQKKNSGKNFNINETDEYNQHFEIENNNNNNNLVGTPSKKDVIRNSDCNLNECKQMKQYNAFQISSNKIKSIRNTDIKTPKNNLINLYNNNIEKSHSFYIKRNSPKDTKIINKKINKYPTNGIKKFEKNRIIPTITSEKKISDKVQLVKKNNANIDGNYLISSMKKIIPININEALNNSLNEDIDNNLNINLNINQEINNINYTADSNTERKININNTNNSGTSKNYKENNLIGEIKVKKKTSSQLKEQLILEKIKELDEETKKFKEERNKITELKNEYEKLNKKLLNDIDEFNIKKEKFEKLRQTDSTRGGKISNPPLIFSENKIITSLKMQNQSLLLNSKKDKETIKTLKNQITNLENIINQKNEEIKIYKKIINNYNENKNENVNKDFDFKIVNNEDEDIQLDSNYKTSTNFAKNYFDVNKNSKKIKQEKSMNSSFSKNDIMQHKVTVKTTLMQKKETDKIFKKKAFNTTNPNKKSDINNKPLNPNNKIKKNNPNSTEKYGVLKKIKMHPSKLDSKQILDKVNDTNINESNDKNSTQNLLNNNTIITSSNQKPFKVLRKSLVTNSSLNNHFNIETDKNNTMKSNKIISNKSSSIKKEMVIPMKSLRNSATTKVFDIHVNNNINYEDNIVENYDFIIPNKYKNLKNDIIEKSMESDGKKINIYSNNKKEIIFQSGVKKEIFSDGYQLVYFPNGDKKQNFPDGKIIYFFNEEKTVQTTFKNGINVFKFSNNQIEKHYPDGSKFVIFPNGEKKHISKDGIEENEVDEGTISVNRKKLKKDEDELMSDTKNNGNERINDFMLYSDTEQNDELNENM